MGVLGEVFNMNFPTNKLSGGADYYFCLSIEGAGAQERYALFQHSGTEHTPRVGPGWKAPARGMQR